MWVCSSTAALLQRKRLAAREALLQAVPVPDLVLAEAPAEEHLLALAPRREVDEPRLVDTRHAAGDARHLLVQPLLHVLQLLRLDVAPVARDPLVQRRLQLLQLEERTAVLDQLLGQRPHLPQRLVRLFSREVARRHTNMIRPSCARVNGLRSLSARPRWITGTGASSAGQASSPSWRSSPTVRASAATGPQRTSPFGGSPASVPGSSTRSCSGSSWH